MFGFTLYPMKLRPPLKDYLWGGTRLKTEYHKASPLKTIAESWELACHKDGMSVILNGWAAGMTLGAFIQKAGKSVLGTNAQSFPYFPLLVKLIDAEQDLSIQVHPDDDYAMRAEGEYGKTEMWYIVDCKPDAHLIYGVNRELSPGEFARHVREGTLLDVCNQVPVRKGDVFFIPAGTLHAIGKGILVAEIQQNANTSYRIHDYGRRDKNGQRRELHLRQAQEILRLKPSAERTIPLEIGFLPDCRVQVLASCPYFTAYHLDLNGHCALVSGQSSFQAITLLSGKAHLLAQNANVVLEQGDSVFLPAGMGRYALHGQGSLMLSMV